MEQLFAPWRIEWVKREEPAEAGECVFCALPTEETDRENLIVAESQRAYVLLNNYPYNPGHLMVIPRVHEGRVVDLSPATRGEIMELIAVTTEVMETALEPDGFNVGFNLGQAAGGSITEHVHAHIVPRWSGDANFMAVIDETHVIVEALNDTYDRVHAAFADRTDTTSHDGATAVSVDLPER